MPLSPNDRSRHASLVLTCHALFASLFREIDFSAYHTIKRERASHHLTSDPALRSPFLLLFDVAADDVGNIGVLFFLLLDKGVVVIVERLVDLDFFFLLDPGLPRILGSESDLCSNHRILRCNWHRAF